MNVISNHSKIIFFLIHCLQAFRSSITIQMPVASMMSSELQATVIHADVKKLNHAISNILQYAVDVSPRSGVITVSTSVVRDDSNKSSTFVKYFRVNIRIEGPKISKVTFNVYYYIDCVTSHDCVIFRIESPLCSLPRCW